MKRPSGRGATCAAYSSAPLAATPTQTNKKTEKSGEGCGSISFAARARFMLKIVCKIMVRDRCAARPRLLRSLASLLFLAATSCGEELPNHDVRFNEIVSK